MLITWKQAATIVTFTWFRGHHFKVGKQLHDVKVFTMEHFLILIISFCKMFHKSLTLILMYFMIRSKTLKTTQHLTYPGMFYIIETLVYIFRYPLFPCVVYNVISYLIKQTIPNITLQQSFIYIYMSNCLNWTLLCESLFYSLVLVSSGSIYIYRPTHAQ